MSNPTTISIDAMGGDFGPSAIVPGVERAAEVLSHRNVRFLLHGDSAQIEAALGKKHVAQIEIRHADTVIAMDEKPAQAMRRGKGSSMWNAVEAVKTGEANACVSAGNTGALMAISRLVLRMVGGLDRPAIVASWPGLTGMTTVLDVGANIDCDAERLLDFAIMGEAFHRAVHDKPKPTIGLLNVGSEDMKGHQELQEAHKLLREGGLPLDYRGFVEGDDLSKGVVDVVVTDGFTGNVALKTAEGIARFVYAEMRAAFTSSARAKLGGIIAKDAISAMKARLDPNAVNGGPLLGLNGLVVKSHGGANAYGFCNAICVATELAQSHFADEIRANMERLTNVLAQASQGAAS